MMAATTNDETANTETTMSGNEADQRTLSQRREGDDVIAQEKLDETCNGPWPKDDDSTDKRDETTCSPTPMVDTTANDGTPFLMADTLKRGAVAVAGGTLVVVGLLMIPLPTPIGEAMACSGMVVLGNEFEQVQDFNQKVLNSTKLTLKYARDRLQQNVETKKKVETIECTTSSTEQGQEVTLTEISDDDDSPGTQSTSSYDLNLIDQDRQMEQEQPQQQQPRPPHTLQKASLFMQKHTSKFLTGTVLPFLDKVTKVADKEAETRTECDPHVTAQQQTELAEKTTSTVCSFEDDDDDTKKEDDDTSSSNSDSSEENYSLVSKTAPDHSWRDTTTSPPPSPTSVLTDETRTVLSMS